MNFLITLVVFTASLFFMVYSIRYGLLWMRRLDSYFSDRTRSNYPGFRWYYRIPFSIGAVPEYFFAMVLGHNNYFTRDWWALKTASFISILVFIAALKSRSIVYDYFSFNFLLENGTGALFTSGTMIWYLNIVLVLFAALFVLICIESIKMYRFYAPIRILAFTLLSFFMAYLTVMTLSFIIFMVVVYFAFKLIVFFFFSSKDKKDKKEDSEETATSILRGGFKEFKSELYEWEKEENDDVHFDNNNEEKATPIKRRRPKITRRRKKVHIAEDVPRIHPD